MSRRKVLIVTSIFMELLDVAIVNIAFPDIRSLLNPPKHDPGDGSFAAPVQPRGQCRVRPGLRRPRPDGRHPRRQRPGLDRHPATTADRQAADRPPPGAFG